MDHPSDASTSTILLVRLKILKPIRMELHKSEVANPLLKIEQVVGACTPTISLPLFLHYKI